jgi:hypothetical protein
MREACVQLGTKSREVLEYLSLLFPCPFLEEDFFSEVWEEASGIVLRKYWLDLDWGRVKEELWSLIERENLGKSTFGQVLEYARVDSVNFLKFLCFLNGTDNWRSLESSLIESIGPFLETLVGKLNLGGDNLKVILEKLARLIEEYHRDTAKLCENAFACVDLLAENSVLEEEELTNLVALLLEKCSRKHMRALAFSVLEKLVKRYRDSLPLLDQIRKQALAFLETEKVASIRLLSTLCRCSNFEGIWPQIVDRLTEYAETDEKELVAASCELLGIVGKQFSGSDKGKIVALFLSLLPLVIPAFSLLSQRLIAGRLNIQHGFHEQVMDLKVKDLPCVVDVSTQLVAFIGGGGFGFFLFTISTIL